jgi:choline dehydrogenase-like flavoprotein
VKGVDRLRVADASVMPNVTVRATPTRQTIMIGERAAELIAAGPRLPGSSDGRRR